MEAEERERWQHRGPQDRTRESWLRWVVRVGILVGAQVVAIAFVAFGHFHAATNPDFGFAIDESARIRSIDRERPGAQELRLGDRLVAVGPEGKVREPIRSAIQWLKRSREMGEGPVSFRFQRGSETLEATLSPRRPSLWPGAAWSLGSFAVVLGLCVILWLSRRREPGLNWYIVVILNVYLVLYGFTHMKEILSSTPLFVTYLFFDLFTLPLLLHLFLRYPTPMGWVARRPLLPLVFYLPQAAVTLATAVLYLRLVSAPTPENQAHLLLLAKWFVPLVFLAYILVALGVMVLRYITSPVEARRQTQWVIYGGVVAAFLALGFSALQYRTTDVAWLLESSTYLLPVYALLALTIGFSFLEFRLVDVDRIVHRSLVYGVVSGLVVLIYLALAGGLGFLLTKVFGTTSTTVTVVATVGSAALFFPLRRAVQANVDRLFFRHRTVYEEILAHASSEFVTLLDLDRLSKVLLEMLVIKLDRRHALLLLAGPDRRLNVVRSAGRPMTPSGPLPAIDSFTLRKLRAHSSGEMVAVARLLSNVQPPRLAKELAAIFESLEASLLVFLVKRDRILGLLVLGPKVDGSMVTRDEITMLEALGRQLSVVVQNASAYTEIEKLSQSLARQRQEILALKNRLEAENVYLREEVQALAYFGDIVGESPGIKDVLARVARVAPSDATVLIRGESGTGKELIARAIHEASPRGERPLVAVNCAAIPEGLLESELFGHVKGAFTGAVARQRGRFELADGGTLFFDEVGDMPPSLQAKLLRALQEREVLPVGGERPVPVDVRVISATHRDLAARVAEGRFREDLFYRLNVVPIDLPPLRERREDIPLLAEHFAALFASRSGKTVTGISRRALDRLMDYPFPGNVRELANVMERAVVLSESSLLDEEVTLPNVAGPGKGGDVGATSSSASQASSSASQASSSASQASSSASQASSSASQGSSSGDGAREDNEAPPEELLPFHEAVADFKRRHIASAIARTEGNKAEAARLLGLQRTYLYRLEKQLGDQ